MNDNFYRHLIEALENKTQCWIVTVTDNIGSSPATLGIKMLVTNNGNYGTVGGGESEKLIIERIKTERPTTLQKWEYNFQPNTETDMICGGSMKVMVESLNNQPILYILGAGHCGIALSELSSKAGFLPIVCDNRPDWCNHQKHPYAHKCLTVNYENCLEEIVTIENTFAVIMTSGHQFDKVVLSQLINKPFKYLGMMGSKTKVAQILGELKEEGYFTEKPANLHSPIGLKIGSQTPWEIAVSICAELIKVRSYE